MSEEIRIWHCRKRLRDGSVCNHIWPGRRGQGKPKVCPRCHNEGCIEEAAEAYG